MIKKFFNKLRIISLYFAYYCIKLKYWFRRDEKYILKRIADTLEKLAVGGFVVTYFQDKYSITGFVAIIVLYLLCLILDNIERKL